MTVRELLRRMDSRELTEWQLEYAREPWGEVRRFAYAVTNPNTGKSEDKVAANTQKTAESAKTQVKYLREIRDDNKKKQQEVVYTI